MAAEDLIREVSGNLKTLINAESVIGSPIDIGNRIVIPVTKFGLGFGAGIGNGGCGDGSGGGGGGGIDTVAVIISHKDISGPEGIQIISLNRDNPIAQVITALGETLVPQVIDLVKKSSTSDSSENAKKKDSNSA